MPSHAEQLLELASQNGAQAAEVCEVQGRSHPVFFEANRLKQIETNDSQGIALRVWQNNRPGLAIAYGSFEPQTLVDRALALSQLQEPEEIELNSTTVNEYAATLGQAVEVSQLLAWGEEAIAAVQTAYPEVICQSEWNCETESFRMVNSLGLDCGYSDISLAGYLGAEWVRDEDFLNVWYAESQRDQLSPETLVANILQRLAWAKENANPPTTKVPILFTAKAAEVLFGTIAAAFSGKQVEQQATPWLNKIGTKVIDARLSLSQDPQLAPFSLPFDDEGTPTQAFTWIEHGVLQGFYGDRRIGKKLNLPARGNGFRHDLGSYPSPGLFNLIVESGDRTLTEMIASMADGLVIDQILGDGGGLSGDFSFNVELGYRVKQGKMVGRVKDTMVAGNAYQALNQIVGLGNQREWHGSLYTPALIVEGLTITS